PLPVVRRESAMLLCSTKFYAGRTKVAPPMGSTRTEAKMSNWMRRIRGAVGMGITWALAWFGAGLVLLVIVGPNAADVPFPLFFGLLGFLGGLVFSGILGLVERRRRFEQMSLPRFAGWGAAGGLL